MVRHVFVPVRPWLFVLRHHILFSRELTLFSRDRLLLDLYRLFQLQQLAHEVEVRGDDATLALDERIHVCHRRYQVSHQVGYRDGGRPRHARPTVHQYSTASATSLVCNNQSKTSLHFPQSTTAFHRQQIEFNDRNVHILQNRSLVESDVDRYTCTVTRNSKMLQAAALSQ